MRLKFVTVRFLPAFKYIEYEIERPRIRMCCVFSFSCVLPGFKYIEYEIEGPGIRICFVFSFSCVLPGFNYIEYEIERPFVLFQFPMCFTVPDRYNDNKSEQKTTAKTWKNPKQTTEEVKMKKIMTNPSRPLANSVFFWATFVDVFVGLQELLGSKGMQETMQWRPGTRPRQMWL